MMYNCRILTTEEITDTYNRYMKKDFPRDELKPLSRILFSLDRGQYICYGIFNNDTLCGYAYFASIVNEGKTYYLLDYFAIVERFRDKGVGSEFLRQLYDKVCDVEAVLCEVETVDGISGNENIIRNRRISFYLRNRFIETGVNATSFGVDFMLLELDLGRKHGKDEIRKYYSLLYRSFLPEKIYNKYVKV